MPSEESVERDHHVEIPKEVLENADGYVTVIATPTDTDPDRFEEWVGASGFPEDVWMLVDAESGEIEEEHHV